MKGKKWVWFGLLFILGAAIGLVYFLADTKSPPQWIGVADSESPTPEEQTPAVRVADAGEPAPPAAGNEDVDLARSNARAEVSGEVTTSIGFADSNEGATRYLNTRIEMSVDPAVLAPLGPILWTMLGPIHNPLLNTIEATESDMLGQLILSSRNMIQEAKSPDPKSRPKPKTVSERIIASQTGNSDPVTEEEMRSQNLAIQSQTSGDSSVWNETSVPEKALQKTTSSELGLIGSSLPGPNPFAKEPLSAPLPIGR